jgi:hypothetical protein
MIVNSRNTPGQLCRKALGLTGAGRDGISKTIAERTGGERQLRSTVWLRPAVVAGGAYGMRLVAVHPHLPATGLRPAVVQETIWPTAAELSSTQMPNTTEHAGDSPARPRELVLDLRERAWVIRCGGERDQERAHEVAAAVVETLDLVGIVHCVVSRVLDEGERGRRA